MHVAILVPQPGNESLAPPIHTLSNDNWWELCQIEVA
jgi:hypothetical protein